MKVNTSMSDKLEKVIGKIVMDLMLEAHEKGISLTFEDICKMVGIPEHLVEDTDPENTYFTLNQEFIDAVSDKELREAMIERAFATVH